MSYRSDSLAGTALMTLFVLAFIAVAVVGLVMHVRFVNKCERNGGHIVEYNCITTVNCHTHSTGHGNSYTSCYPSRTCDERCDGANAEAK